MNNSNCENQKLTDVVLFSDDCLGTKNICINRNSLCTAQETSSSYVAWYWKTCDDRACWAPAWARGAPRQPPAGSLVLRIWSKEELIGRTIASRCHLLASGTRCLSRWPHRLARYCHQGCCYHFMYSMVPSTSKQTVAPQCRHWEGGSGQVRNFLENQRFYHDCFCLCHSLSWRARTETWWIYHQYPRCWVSKRLRHAYLEVGPS